MKIKLIFFTFVLLLFIQNSFSQGIVGIWWTEKNESKVKIYESNDKYYGKLIWAADPAQKVQQHVGKIIIDGFVKQEDGTYQGIVHAPHWGKTFKGKITVQSEDKIFLRGYLGIPLFGSTQNWVRAK